MTLFEMAQRFVGEIRELPGDSQHPFIQWAHSLCGLGMDQPDEVAWCSSWLNAICWLLRLPRSKSAAARSWLLIGKPIEIDKAQPGDVVILKRGSGSQPGPEIIAAPGHVGLFAGYDRLKNTVHILGANQGNTVSVAPFKEGDVLGIRRLVG